MNGHLELLLVLESSRQHGRNSPRLEHEDAEDQCKHRFYQGESIVSLYQEMSGCIWGVFEFLLRY